MKSPSAAEQIISILALPFMVLVIIPVLIIYLAPDFTLILIDDISNTVLFVSGLLLFLPGAVLFIQSIVLIVKIGNGTLAPWNPAKKLVIAGLYRHVLNPMISGVILILFAESIFFSSPAIMIWTIIFFLTNHIYFVIKEEPELLKRFGEEYQEYKQNVPRWLPKLRGWNSENKKY